MAEGRLVLGQQLIDTGPCTDNQQANMGELANLLNALGNPAPVPGPGPIDPTTGDPVPPGDTYDNVYVNEDGDLVYIDVNGDEVVIVVGEGSGGESEIRRFYLKIEGTCKDATEPSFDLILSDVELVEYIDANVPKDTPEQVDPRTDLTLTVHNKPTLRTVNNDVVQARYNFELGRWEADSLQNVDANLRSATTWVKAEGQALIHHKNGNPLVWSTPTPPVYIDTESGGEELHLKYDNFGHSAHWPYDRDGTLGAYVEGDDLILYARWEQILANVTGYDPSAQQVITNRNGNIKWETIGSC